MIFYVPFNICRSISVLYGWVVCLSVVVYVWIGKTSQCANAKPVYCCCACKYVLINYNNNLKTSISML